jgi:hypothetical protein
VTSLSSLFTSVRERFPDLAAIADEEHARLGFEVESGSCFLWFESLAKALNLEMSRNVPAEVHEPLFSLIASALATGNGEVKQCIDASFVENLFWQVPSATQIRAYWSQMPSSLQAFYVAFHGHEP